MSSESDTKDTSLLSKNSTSSSDAPKTTTWKEFLETNLKAFIAFVKTRPVWEVALVSLLSFVIVGAGAVIFLALIGALDSDYTKDQISDIVEITSQMLNASFTFICICLFPGRIVAFYQWNFIACRCNEGKDSTDTKVKYLDAIKKLYNWSVLVEDEVSKMVSISDDVEGTRKRRWTWVGILFYVQLLHCLLQYVVAYYMWLFNQNNRPALSYAFIVLAIFFGCGNGIAEGCLASKFKMPA